jgi:CheY-like chemotaxis protein/two-component sensor histidine kinase
LYQSQKLDSIGKLAAGIAHDFNNLLTVIMGNASLLKRKLTSQGFVLEVVDDIISASEKAAELTRKMMLFSRKEPMDFSPVNLNEIILDLMKILTRLIGENIQIHTDLTENLKIIEADKSNIEQVILNVVSNAKDAMTNGGNITLSTKNFIVDNYNKPAIPNSEIGEYVSLVIEDDGCGIDEEILDKIFDPFFTTKEVGKGTGLGLSVVYGIVKKHGGWINIYSEKQIGTSIKIYLPVHSVDSNPEIAEQMNQDFDIDDRDEAILMVEDNSALLKLGVHLLEDYGFIVDFAETAKEAEEIFEKHNCDYDMVISDIVLPDCNGVDLVEKMRKKNPDIRVLFISGYANENLILKIKNNRDMHFLAKPFDHSKLVETIVSIFDE